MHKSFERNRKNAWEFVAELLNNREIKHPEINISVFLVALISLREEKGEEVKKEQKVWVGE